MKLTLDGAQYRIGFRHDALSDGRRATFCFLKREMDGARHREEITVAEGAALCSVEDNFRYEKGRKLALARALDRADFSREVRARFWEAYLRRDRTVSEQFLEQSIAKVEGWLVALKAQLAQVRAKRVEKESHDPSP